MPIFNALSQIFSVAEGCHKALGVSLGSCDHTVTLQKAFCVIPQGAHSAYSYIITSKWFQKSMECCYCRERFPKALDNDSIPVQLPRTRFWKPSEYVQHPTNHTHILYLSNLFPQGLLVLHTVTGSVPLGVLWIPGEKCQETSMELTHFCMIFGIGYNDWAQRVYWIIHAGAQFANTLGVNLTYTCEGCSMFHAADYKLIYVQDQIMTLREYTHCKSKVYACTVGQPTEYLVCKRKYLTISDILSVVQWHTNLCWDPVWAISS